MMFPFKKLPIIINIHGIASLELIGFFFFSEKNKIFYVWHKKAKSVVK